MFSSWFVHKSYMAIVQKSYMGALFFLWYPSSPQKFADSRARLQKLAQFFYLYFYITARWGRAGRLMMVFPYARDMEPVWRLCRFSRKRFQTAEMFAVNCKEERKKKKKKKSGELCQEGADPAKPAG